MNHLIVSREYPPPSYPQGGIGTYVAHIARLLAEQGETVHVIGERWAGAPLARDVQYDGHLIVHRVPMDAALPEHDSVSERQLLRAMQASEFSAQAFSWQAARLAERLVADEAIDCIEAQEFEAPLYFFLLRRALGLGPDRHPPCFVHLHSPTQVICHHNDWDIARPDRLLMKRLEDYVIQASDAALCPSDYLARQAEGHYGLDEGTVERIPLPHGDTPFIERDSDTWQSGAICYFGRMEPRKGVFEWIDAAVNVARERPGLRFEFIGADTPLSGSGLASVRAALQARVPDDLRSAISFLDALPRQSLWQRLAKSRIAVVPSRWENYPNTCVEAMATGLPVLASREGGMIEMVEDGRNGWLASAVTSDALAAALRRALEVPAAALAEMGRQADRDIRRLCDNRSIVARHLAFRERVASRGARQSLSMPIRASSTVLFGPVETVTVPAAPVADTDQGMVLVVELTAADDVEDAIADVAQQTRAAFAVILDFNDLSDVYQRKAEGRFLDANLPVVISRSGDKGRGLHRAVVASGGAGAVGVRASGCRIESRFIEASVSAFARHPAIGVVSHWHADTAGRVAVPPRPARPYQWAFEDVSSCVAFRTRGLTAVDWAIRLQGGYPSVNDLALALLMDGWLGLTFPAALSRRVKPFGLQKQGLERAASVRLRQVLRARYRERWTADAHDVLPLVRALSGAVDFEPSIANLLHLPIGEQLRIAKEAVRSPAKVLSWIATRWRRSARNRGK